MQLCTIYGNGEYICNNSSNKKESIFLITDIDKKITTEMKIDNKQQDLKC